MLQDQNNHFLLLPQLAAPFKKELQEIGQNEIVNYWEFIDNRGIHKELISTYDIVWYKAKINPNDIPQLYIVFAADWHNVYTLITNNDWRLNSVL